jgi:hypothetical protein
MKQSWILAVAVLFVGAQASAQTVAAYGPSSQTGTYVKSTTYYFCSTASGSHTALDICVDTSGNRASCGACNATYVRSMLNGTYAYRLMISSCPSDCDSATTTCGGGAGNYYQVTGSNGYDFRQLHLNPDATTMKTQTVARGAYLGWWGSTGGSTAPHVHADNRQNGTRLSAWYASYVSCGSPATSSNAIGQVRLQ